MSVKAFLLEPTGDVNISLRRYHSGADGGGYHTAQVLIATVPKEGFRYAASTVAEDMPPRDDPRWPKVADDGYVFTDDDVWQVFTESLYRRVDTGERFTLHGAPEGAIWRATWFEDIPDWCGFDGRSYVAKCPGGSDWHIDGRANNCTMPDDWSHRCWVRHGEAPNFTVGKDGVTCSAGAGSIQTHNWHGFLRNGVFE